MVRGESKNIQYTDKLFNLPTFHSIRKRRKNRYPARNNMFMPNIKYPDKHIADATENLIEACPCCLTYKIKGPRIIVK